MRAFTPPAGPQDSFCVSAADQTALVSNSQSFSSVAHDLGEMLNALSTQKTQLVDLSRALAELLKEASGSLHVSVGVFLAVSANASQPRVVPDPCVRIVPGLSKSLGRIFGVYLLPKGRMIVLHEARKAFVMHRPNDLLCRITTLFYLLEKYAIDLTALFGIGFDKLNSKIGARSTIAGLRYGISKGVDADGHAFS